MNDSHDLVTIFKYPRAPYEEQIRLLLKDVERYRSKVCGVRGDSTGIGDFPMEYLRDHGNLPMGEESLFKFTAQSKNELYTNFEAALFRDPGDPLAFSYPARYALASELEEQMTQLLREYKTDAQYLSPHAPEVPGAHDDAPTAVALALLAAAGGRLGDILVL